MEWIFTGYCRAQDQARTVILEHEDGQWEAGCDFPDCAYANVCQIGSQMAKKQEE